MVTLQEDPERIHLEHYNTIGTLFKPDYVISSRDDQDSLIHTIFKRDLSTKVGTVYIAENNHDITLKANPELFMNIAEEIEKLGYEVTIVY